MTQTSLIVAEKPALRTWATFSEHRLHRYELGREIVPGNEKKRTVLFVGLNPSTADETVNDRTISKEIRYARRWGFERLLKGNLFSWRSTDPQGLLTVDHAGWRSNAEALCRMADEAEITIACWGGPYQPKALRELVAERAKKVAALLTVDGRKLHVLGLTKDGIPRHVLYLPDALDPVPWEVA